MIHERRDVVATLAQRRNRDRNDVEAIEQIFLKLALGDHLPQIAVGRRDDAQVDVLGALGAERLELAFLQDAQQFRLHREAHGADLVEEDRAAVGQREFAFLGRRRARKGAPHVPEELGFEERLGNRRAVHFDERHVALGAAVVNRAGDELFAGAGLAGDEDGALGVGHELGAADDFFHRAAAPDDPVVTELLVALVDEVPVLRAEPLMIERAADDDQQLVDLERLLQIIERAELHRLDRAFDGRVGGHHQNLRPLAFGRRADQLADQLQAAKLRHDVVDDQHVERALGEQALGLPRARRLHHVVSGGAQRAAERL